jgi:hypothetical protein
MLKVTITFPSGVTITLETTEADKYGEVIASTREYLGSDGIAPSTNGNLPKPVLQEEPSSNGNGHLASSPEFLEFCQLMAPSGDMRRVVVAAEGAKRFLGMDKISAQELGPLFDFLQWPRPKDFVQTLRNAGRSAFQWLERSPGNSGYYSVTDQGRREIIIEETSNAVD